MEPIFPRHKSLQQPKCEQFWEALHLLRLYHGTLPLTLAKAITSLIGAVATDSRDRVFALLGLISHEESSLIEIDYGLLESRVYTQIMRVSMYVEHSLGLIAHPKVVRRSRLERLPSWVADLSGDSCGEHAKFFIESDPVYILVFTDDTQHVCRLIYKTFTF